LVVTAVAVDSRGVKETEKRGGLYRAKGRHVTNRMQQNMKEVDGRRDG
jgi:hypothetical protein